MCHTLFMLSLGAAGPFLSLHSLFLPYDVFIVGLYYNVRVDHFCKDIIHNHYRSVCAPGSTFI